MITIRKAAERGEFKIDGLVSYHSFSFGDYYDSDQMGFRSLRVINEDTLAGGFGFPTHPHKNMEIVTYVTEGTLEHKDSMGNAAQIHAGELQRMTAGRGVTHSEYNASKAETAKLLQIWLLPEHANLQPGYEQKMIPSKSDGGLTLAAAKGGGEGVLNINQDAKIYVGRLANGESKALPLESRRYGWLQIIDGKLSIGEQILNPGDGAAISELGELVLKARKDAHFLFFDLA